MLFDPIYECLAPNHKTETLCQPFVVTSSVMHIVTFSQNNNSLSSASSVPSSSIFKLISWERELSRAH